jgi:hypothetical protein
MLDSHSGRAYWPSAVSGAGYLNGISASAKTFLANQWAVLPMVTQVRRWLELRYRKISRWIAPALPA